MPNLVARPTTFPCAYPVSPEWPQTPHIHSKVSTRGYHELTTQIYFNGSGLNQTESLIPAMRRNAIPK